MAWIARHHAVVSLADVEAFLAGKKPLGQDAVLVTVDDGSPCLLRHALPILQACGIPAVAFVPAGELDRCDHGIASSRETAEARMTWAELDVLTKAGITIGSHGWTHRSLAGMPIEQAREEATRSRECLEAHVGLPVTAFAYPFGRRADYTAATGRILLECGYACAFTARHGAIRVGLDPFTLPRIKIEGGDPLWIFQLASTGALDAWSLVDRRLWWLQAGV
jgi:peptidoglycan/xylan/chitin deacetylase (PgdA/CDA1 family)